MTPRTTVYRPYLLVAFSSLFLLGFTDNARPPLFPRVLEDLDLGDGRGALMFSATSAGVVVGSLLFRWLVKRMGSLRALQLGLVAMAIGAASTGFVDGLKGLVAASLGFGAAFGGLGIAQNLMVEQATPPALRRRGLSALHCLYALASLLTPLAVDGVLNQGWTWKHVFWGLGVPPLVLAALCLFARPLPAEPEPEPEPDAPDPPASTPPSLLRQVGLATIIATCVLAELLVSTRLPQLLEREGHSRDEAALGLSAFFLCLLISRVGFSALPLRISNRSLLLASGGISFTILLVGLLVEPWLLPLAALSLGPFFPTGVDLLAEEFPGRLESALSVLFVVISTVLTLGHTAAGVLSEALSLRIALGLGPAALAVTCLLLLLLVRPQRS